MATPSAPVITSPPENRSEAAVIIAETKRLGTIELIPTADYDGESRAVLASVPQGRQVVDITPMLDQYLTKPWRRRGTATLTDADSFIAHLGRFMSQESAVFANPDRQKPSLTAVYDYHPISDKVTEADFLGHRAVYAPQLSDEWRAWNAKSGQSMPQADFASFIEDRITDVIVPNLDDPKIKTFAELVQGKFASPSELLALSRNLAVNVETAVRNAIVLTTGEISVRYDETHKDGEGRPIDIANLFQICVPVFVGGPLYIVAARLRYRLLAGGKITWSYQLVRPDIAFDDAFNGIVDKVRAEGTPVFLGAPEA